MGDINAELINAYKLLKHAPLQLYQSILRHKPTKKEYYKVRQQVSTEKNSLSRASRFIFLNRNCFNGLYRTNAQGNFNVPFGRDTGTFPTKSQFQLASVALRNAKIRVCDFEKTLATVSAGDFVYLDPPYVYAGRKDRGEYGQNSFCIEDLERLRVSLHKIDKKGACFLLSYVECDELQPFIKKWHSTKIPVRRNISGFAKFRTTVNEVLISNLPLIKK